MQYGRRWVCGNGWELLQAVDAGDILETPASGLMKILGKRTGHLGTGKLLNINRWVLAWMGVGNHRVTWRRRCRIRT